MLDLYAEISPNHTLRHLQGTKRLVGHPLETHSCIHRAIRQNWITDFLRSRRAETRLFFSEPHRSPMAFREGDISDTEMRCNKTVVQLWHLKSHGSSQIFLLGADLLRNLKGGLDFYTIFWVQNAYDNMLRKNFRKTIFLTTTFWVFVSEVSTIRIATLIKNSISTWGNQQAGREKGMFQVNRFQDSDSGVDPIPWINDLHQGLIAKDCLGISSLAFWGSDRRKRCGWKMEWHPKKKFEEVWHP